MRSFLSCYGLLGIDDTRRFCKADMQDLGTVARLQTQFSIEVENESRAIALLKQKLKCVDYSLTSKERNIQNKKTIFYQIRRTCDVPKLHHMTKMKAPDAGLVDFET